MMILMWITMMLFIKSDSTQTIPPTQTNLIITAEVGQNVTLRCFTSKQGTSTDSIIWYKQKIGHEPRLMVTVLKKASYEDELKSPRFSIEEEITGCHLKIANVEPSDEGIYYCGILKFIQVFGKGTFLSVKGVGDLKVSVLQSNMVDSVPAGASVTLQCSVLSEIRAAELQVLWFRAASPQSHPQIIYTHHNQSESGSSTNTCVYSFKNISRNDFASHYCAVAVCGKIVFGKATQIQKERPVNPVVIWLAVALGVCVLVMFALILIIIYKGINLKKQHVARSNQGSMKDKTLNQVCDNVELSYAALHFSERKAKRGRVKKQQPQDIIYSDVQYSSIA